MTENRALKIVFIISLAGALFSGMLTYQMLCNGGAHICLAPGAPGIVLGYPAVMFDFFVFIVLAGISGWALHKKKRG